MLLQTKYQNDANKTKTVLILIFDTLYHLTTIMKSISLMIVMVAYIKTILVCIVNSTTFRIATCVYL